jgi:hypothetical protein
MPKEGCVLQAQRGFSGYDIGVRNLDIVVACKQALLSDHHVQYLECM